MGPIIVRQISAAETHPVRWKILRPGFPVESVEFEGDSDPSTLHFGVFLENHLVGVASLYVAALPDHTPHAMQLRGMATLQQVRGKHCGIHLLNACCEAGIARGVPLLWCNARESALGFYSKQGWEVHSPRFEIPTVGPHFRMVRFLSGQLRRNSVSVQSPDLEPE